MNMHSLSGKSEDVDYDVVILEWIFLAEVAVVLGVPEATCRHVETTVSFLQDDHVCGKLQIFVYVLQQFDDNFTRVIAPLLSFLAVVVSDFECLEDHIVDLFLYSRSHFVERYCLGIWVWLLCSSIVCVYHYE